MTDKQALIALRDAVVAGNAKHGDFRCLEVPMQDTQYTSVPDNARCAHKGSIDAAISLLEAMLPKWSYRLQSGYAKVHHPNNPMKDSAALNVVTSRALLIATLDALIAGASE